MIRNYTTDSDLQSYVPNLTNLLWNGQTDFSAQKQSAEIEVMNDFIKRNYKAIYLRNDLMLRNSGTAITSTTSEDLSDEDTITRMRFVVDCKTFTGTQGKTITLYGSNDSGDTYVSIDSLTITETGISSLVITEFYKCYKVTATVPDGSIDYSAYMTETSYDLLHIFKQLVIILTPLVKDENSTYGLLLAEFKRKYENEWTQLKVYYDSSESGDLDNLTVNRNNSINYYK
jgi:hypothetical protein